MHIMIAVIGHRFFVLDGGESCEACKEGGNLKINGTYITAEFVESRNHSITKIVCKEVLLKSIDLELEWFLALTSCAHN